MIIIGSTRPGRVGPSVAAWITERAREHGGFDVQVTDLAELNLPMLDEPNHPRLRQYTKQHTKDWSALVDGVRRVHLRDARVQLRLQRGAEERDRLPVPEWQNKAAGIVSYGGVAAGTRATQMLKQVLTALKIMPVPEAVNIPFVAQHLDEDKRFKSTELIDASATAMLDELREVDRRAAERCAAK